MFKRKSLKQKIGLLLFIVVLVFTVIASYLVSTNVLPYDLLVPQTFSPQALKEDFLFLRKTLEEGHPGLYRYTSKAEMDRLFDETQQQLNHPMDEIAFYRILAPLIAAIKDGHTSLEPATIVSDQLTPQNDFPFSVRVLGNKVFIFDDFATPYHALAGAEILFINGVPIETILQTMLAGITGDGNIVMGKEHHLGGGGGLGYYRALFSPMLYPLLDIKSPFTLKYRPFQQVQERTIQITGRPFNDLVANALTFSFLSPTQQADPLPANEFALQADGKYHWVKHLMGLLQPRQPHFAGKVYMLINGGCFSACAEFVSTMQFHKKATFIGEEVGGGYYGNTSGFPYNVYLPHTKIVLVIPVVAYYLSVRGYAHADQGVMPDYPVQSTIEDLLAGKDNDMTLALSLARGEHP